MQDINRDLLLTLTKASRVMNDSSKKTLVQIINAAASGEKQVEIMVEGSVYSKENRQATHIAELMGLDIKLLRESFVATWEY